jgi:hypothetical protein
VSRTVFFRLLDADDKAGALLSLKSQVGAGKFEVDPSDFSAIPRSPFAYWASPALRQTFAAGAPFENDRRVARVGLATANDFRFLRAWWSVPPASAARIWRPFGKGGSSSSYYANVPLVLNWTTGEAKPDGWELKAFAETTPGTTHWSRNIRSTEYYFRPGLTWPLRAPRFAAYPLPAGAVFSVRGYCAFTPPDDLAPTMAVFNSRVFDYLFKLTVGRDGFPEFIVGVLQTLPWAVPDEARRAELAMSARRAYSCKRRLDSCTETSHAFTIPALLQTQIENFAASAERWASDVHLHLAEVESAQARIDEICYGLYGVNEEDRQTIDRSFGRSLAGPAVEAEHASSDENEDEDDSPILGNALLTAQFLSWTPGVSFGRFDLRLATGERQPPPEPDPFDPLPACSPGMLTGDDGLPLAAPPPNYPIAFPTDGILVDDTGHDRDILARIHQVFTVLFGDHADDRLQEAVSILDPSAKDLRPWLRRTFFEEHIQRYSKSRRKAPIYWRLGTPSGSYSVWVYIHRFDKDTLYKVLNEQVAPKLRYEQGKLDTLRAEVGPSPTPSQARGIAAQETLVDELRAVHDEVERVAPLWDPDLDDGVVINASFLHRLFAHTRAWQKECESHWQKLQKGEYDWAHLAMRLWPERVVPKCTEDRSLAIAHGLEDVLWLEGTDGKWRPLHVTDAEIAALVQERTSTAVKDALRRMGETPEPVAVRKVRAAAPVGEAKQTRKAKAARQPGAIQLGLGLADDPTPVELDAVRAALASADDGLPKADLLAASGLDEGAAAAALAALMQTGEVVKIGAARGTRYRLGGGPLDAP